jgi:hypothetical protein
MMAITIMMMKTITTTIRGMDPEFITGSIMAITMIGMPIATIEEVLTGAVTMVIIITEGDTITMGAEAIMAVGDTIIKKFAIFTLSEYALLYVPRVYS